MGKLTLCLLSLAILVSGCTFSYEVITPEPTVTESATPQLTAESTQDAATPVATISATPVPVAPTLAPPTTHPIFFNGRSAATSDEYPTRQSSFPAGTKIVYVIWDYQNMRDGMLVRREWHLNGQPWLTREEAWDFAKYGSTGTMRDVSIHDEINGLDLGIYHLRIYIDGVLQPLGGLVYEPIQEWVTFEIGMPEQESFMGYGSWDGQWGVEVYGGNRVVLKNTVNGESREIVIVQEVAYVNWFKDNRHFLFVDRDRSEQQPGTTVGVRDHLWIVEVPSGVARRVYRGDIAFAGTLGPDPSPDGKYIASLAGSGYSDACFVDKRLIFFEVASDFNSVETIAQEQFSGFPVFPEGTTFPLEAGFWENESSYYVTLSAACNTNLNDVGNFRFNLQARTASRDSGQTVPGDLGLGMVHGKVTDVTGAPIPNATVTCEHHAYQPAPPCTGIVWTAVDGAFAFSNVFFHDTDSIKIIVQASGYESQEITKSSFTTNDWEVNVALNRAP